MVAVPIILITVQTILLPVTSPIRLPRSRPTRTTLMLVDQRICMGLVQTRLHIAGPVLLAQVVGLALR